MTAVLTLVSPAFADECSADSPYQESAKLDKSAKYLAKAAEAECRGDFEKAEKYRAKAAKYAAKESAETTNPSKAEKYAAKAEERALEGDLDKARYYAAKARKYADKYAAQCWPSVNASFSNNGLAVDISADKELSNVVLLFTDGSVEKLDNLSGHERTVAGQGPNAGKTLGGVWIKAGCNHSGDGPGYGEFVENCDAVTFVPVISINDNPLISEPEAENVEALFIVSLSEAVPVGTTVRVDYMTADGSAYQGSDYVFETATVEFLPGEMSKSISITVIGEEGYEDPEYFYIDLINPYNATIGRDRAKGTIYDARGDW